VKNKTSDFVKTKLLSLQNKDRSGKDHGGVDRKMIKVNLADILYIESIKDYIKVVGTSGTVITKQSIFSVEEDLPKDMFIRIHRSYIVALNKIESYSNELIWLGKAELPSAECTGMKWKVLKHK
jgi:DNA-binding LytR/AlgR family response regulator